MKRKWFTVLMICLLLSGCSAKSEPVQSNGYAFVDSMGRSVTVFNPQRVGIASGSFAECWMLAGGTVTAVTRDALTERELDLPENVADLGALKEPSAEAILDADLDFVILMAGLKNHVVLGETLEKAKIPHAYFEMEDFSDYLDLLKIFTDITGRSDLYVANGTALKPGIEAAIAAGEQKEPASVLVLRTSSSNVKAQSSETMVGGMLKEFGCINIADSDSGLLDDLSLEAIVQTDPDYIFVVCMGDEEEARVQLQYAFASNPIWQTLTAVQNNRYHFLPKDLFHHKPNARWEESYETLAELLAQD